MTPESIEDWRRRIDEIDRQLVELLNERARCAIEIGRLKRAVGLPLYQPDREKEVLKTPNAATPVHSTTPRFAACSSG